MSEQAGMKEPNFFNFDQDHPWLRTRTEDEYLALFRDAPQGAEFLGEATTNYLYSEVAAKELLHVSPDARLVVTVRNPIEMVQSLFNQYTKVHGENVSSFEEGWVLQHKRLLGQVMLPSGWSDPKLLQYGAIAKVGEQIERLLNYADADQVHVIVYDDFARDPKTVYCDLLNFLGLVDDGRFEFPTLNQRRNYRFPTVHKILGHVESIRKKIGVSGGWGINALIDRFNVIEGPASQVVGKDLMLEMVEYFNKDVTLLSNLLGRDLTHWMDV